MSISVWFILNIGLRDGGLCKQGILDIKIYFAGTVLLLHVLIKRVHILNPSFSTISF